MEDVKRGPGRPKAVNTLKKGNVSWQPASLNNFDGKEDGYRYRMMRNDQENLAKKKQEGWEVVSAIQSPQTEHQDPNRIEDGKPLTSVLEGRDWTMGRIPEELAVARDEYMNQKSDRQLAGLTAHAKKDLGKIGAEMHGDITISSRKEH